MHAVDAAGTCAWSDRIGSFAMHDVQPARSCRCAVAAWQLVRAGIVIDARQQLLVRINLEEFLIPKRLNAVFAGRNSQIADE